MKQLTITFAAVLTMLVAFNSQAQEQASLISGKVQKFSTNAIEGMGGKVYFAVEVEHERILLPKYVDAKALYERAASVTVEGTVAPVMCTDMSDACPTGYFDQVQSLKVRFNQ